MDSVSAQTIGKVVEAKFEAQSLTIACQASAYQCTKYAMQ